ncbi:hypothetical protein [Streptomyces sp. NPDC056683]|uniref:hypothetical protein n=1 Tax=Streptomyces sp. NPDC056683 TaxID=3345910 RepID=UPI0036744070
MSATLTPYCTDPDCINPRYSHHHGAPTTGADGEPECREWCGTVNGRTVHAEGCHYRQYFRRPTAPTR